MHCSRHKPEQLLNCYSSEEKKQKKKEKRSILQQTNQQIHSLQSTMLIPTFLLFLMQTLFSSGQEHPTGTGFRLSKPLIGGDGRIYTCSERNVFVFESNGSISWTIHLPYTCEVGVGPVHGGRGKIFLVAEDRVLEINFLDVAVSPPTAKVFFGPEKGQKGAGEIIGLAVSTMSSSVFINVKHKGLFVYTLHGKPLWSVGPVGSQFGYRLGCRKSISECYFTSIPVIDQCEASVYIANSVGELYSLSLRGPYFNWVQDLSSFDRIFTITPGNNGRLYATVPTRALVLALDVSTGNVLWQNSIGPLSSADSAAVVDSNGWLSIGSLDGFLYSISPAGTVKKFSKVSELDYVIQASPFLDCSGYAVYISQTEMDGKTSRVIDEYIYVSALRPKGVIFTLLAPATGAVYWSERYPGQISSSFSQSDLRRFVLDEGTLLAFVAASGAGNSLTCRTKYQKLLSICAEASPNRPSIYTGNERTMVLFLFFESIVLVVLAGLVRFCCIFWKKKKLQGQNLGFFFEKRRSLQVKKKALDRTITELEQKAAEAAVADQVIDELGDLVQEREVVERKLSTTYSLGRDRTSLQSKSKSLLPLSDSSKRRSYSFRSGNKESVTLFHTLSDSSSGESSSDDDDESSWVNVETENQIADKGKSRIESTESSSGDHDHDHEIVVKKFKKIPSEPASGSKGCVNPLFLEQEVTKDELKDKGEVMESTRRSSGKVTLFKRRKTLSFN